MSTGGCGFIRQDPKYYTVRRVFEGQWRGWYPINNLRGVVCGGAMISPKHPNFIVNALDAKAEDVKSLIGLVKETVLEKFGIKLEEEVQFV